MDTPDFFYFGIGWASFFISLLGEKPDEWVSRLLFLGEMDI